MTTPPRAASATSAHAYSTDGGLAVLYGNIAEDGCIVKTAGVDESIWKFEGRPACSSRRTLLATPSSPTKWGGRRRGHRLRGPQGRPGMQEMLYPTSFLKGKGLGKACALITDGRFSGRHVGPQHRPRFARGGRRGSDRARRGGGPHPDRHPSARRSISVVSDETFAARRRTMVAKGHDALQVPIATEWSPPPSRLRLMTTSAARGAVRDLSQLKPR